MSGCEHKLDLSKSLTDCQPSSTERFFGQKSRNLQCFSSSQHFLSGSGDEGRYLVGYIVRQLKHPKIRNLTLLTVFLSLLLHLGECSGCQHLTYMTDIFRMLYPLTKGIFLFQPAQLDIRKSLSVNRYHMSLHPIKNYSTRPWQINETD